MAPLLKKALPRVYDEVAAHPAKHEPELLTQLDALSIVGRCNCGSAECVQPHFSSPRQVHSVKDSPPVYYDVDDSHIVMGISNTHGLVTLEIIEDYADGYVQQKLEKFGFPRTVCDDE